MSHRKGHLIRAMAMAIAGCLLIAGCTADRPRSERQSSGPPPLPCPTSAELSDGTGGPQRQGTGTDATLWALFFGPKAVAGQEIKIAWRMTGAGDLTMNATGENGATVKPVWGPEAHPSSTFQRPGEEWGTGWVFPTAGCWTFNATRTTGRAQLAIRVA